VHDTTRASHSTHRGRTPRARRAHGRRQDVRQEEHLCAANGRVHAVRTAKRAASVEPERAPANRLVDEARARNQRRRCEDGRRGDGRREERSVVADAGAGCEVWAAPIEREESGQSEVAGTSRVLHAGAHRGECFRVASVRACGEVPWRERWRIHRAPHVCTCRGPAIARRGQPRARCGEGGHCGDARGACDEVRAASIKQSSTRSSGRVRERARAPCSTWACGVYGENFSTFIEPAGWGRRGGV
jgi:hypothetical protein